MVDVLGAISDVYAKVDNDVTKLELVASVIYIIDISQGALPTSHSEVGNKSQYWLALPTNIRVPVSNSV